MLFWSCTWLVLIHFSGCTTASIYLLGSQAWVGAVQWVCLDNQELHSNLHWHQGWLVSLENILYRYSVLLENTLLEKFIRNYIQNPRHILNILTNENIDDIISCFFTVVFSNSQFVCMIKRNLHGGWEYEFYFQIVKTIFYKQAQRVYVPLENNIHIFAPPCNALYV